MSELQKDLLKMVENMPAFPRSVHRIMQLTNDINCSPKELIQVIHHDPVMTLKILRMVNSPYFGLSQKISSINRAVVFVGINTIKNLAVSIASMGMLPTQNRGGLGTADFLLHSLGVATVAKSLGRKLGVSDREGNDYFVAGLLHDFGKVVFSQFAPQRFERATTKAAAGTVSLHLAEQEFIGADHAQIGAMLSQKWQLSAELSDTIQHHHLLDESSSRMTLCVFAANQITKSLHYGNGGNGVIEPLPEYGQKILGGDLETVSATLGDLTAELEKARLFLHV